MTRMQGDDEGKECKDKGDEAMEEAEEDVADDEVEARWVSYSAEGRRASFVVNYGLGTTAAFPFLSF